MDLFDLEDTIRTLRRLRPKVVFLAAAMTDVDGCESHPEQAAAVNAEAPGKSPRPAPHWAPDSSISPPTTCSRDRRRRRTERRTPWNLRVPMAGQSSPANGTSSRPCPRLSSSGRARTSMDLHRGKTNAVTWIWRNSVGASRPRSSQTSGSRPSYVPEVARIAFDLLDRDAHGIFHVSSKDCLNRLEIGKAVCKTFGFSEDLLKPTRLEDLHPEGPPASPQLPGDREGRESSEDQGPEVRPIPSNG